MLEIQLFSSLALRKSVKDLLEMVSVQVAYMFLLGIKHKICFLHPLPYKFYVLGQVSANSSDQDQTASSEAV